MPLKFQENASLQAYNTMAVPAHAKRLVTVKNIDELKIALAYADQNTLDTLILGEGSNTLFVNNYPGLVILNRLAGIELIAENANSVTIKVASGESWHKFVAHTLDNKWFGLENLALIPGLVGAAPMQNIGAYGVEIKDHLVSVEYFDIKNKQLTVLNKQNCQLAYRDSIFKKSLAGIAVICSVTFTLSKNESVNLSYPALANHFGKNTNPGAQQVFEAICEIRSSKLPDPAIIPNSGSFFQNPIVSNEVHTKLKSQYPDLPSFAVTANEYKLAAAWMIEYLGWKNKIITNVCVHKTQALVITNPKFASGVNVLKFANDIQGDILDCFGVNLEIEPQLI